MIYDFSSEFKVLYEYFGHSFLFFKKYLVKEKEYLEAMKNGDIVIHNDFEYLVDSTIDGLEGELYEKSKHLLPIAFESTLIMAYTLFENFLSKIVDDVSNKNKMKYVEIDFEYKKKMSVVDKYLYYLSNCAVLNLKLTVEQKTLLYVMRKIRNYYVHDKKGKLYL